MSIDFSFLLEPPDFSAKKLLIIEPLTPLSMVAGLSGKYYRSQSKPTDIMLYGMIENALGWHLDSKERDKLLFYWCYRRELSGNLDSRKRDKLIQDMKKNLGVELISSGIGFTNILQHHVRFSEDGFPSIGKQDSFHYDDLWSQHLKGASFVGGSRNYSHEAIPLMNAVEMLKKAKERKIEIADGSEQKGFSKNPNKIIDFSPGDKIHLNVLKPYFPQYYISPTPREYVAHNGFFVYLVETSQALLSIIGDAIAEPQAPLYLGTNDGWVDAILEEIP